MYPGSIFEIVDQSDIQSIEVADTIEKPIQMIGFTSDKGTEDYIYIEGEDFFKQYGESISFARHGQPLLQAANAINYGAKLFCKRVVAQDSTLANNGVVAYVKVENTQRTDADGNLLYIDATTGEETTVADGNEAAIDTAAKVDFNVISVESTNSNDLETVATKFKDSVKDGYPLFLFTDVGRGVSNKRITITPDYNLSRTSEYAKYILRVIENNESLDEVVATLNPDIVESSENINFATVLNGVDNNQVRCKVYEDGFTKFVAAIKEALANEAVGLAEEEIEDLDLEEQDLLFGMTIKGAAISDKLTYAEDSPLKSIYGISLDNGSNGKFGTVPIESAEYAKEMAKVFNGDFSDDIYNMDNNPIDLIIDANYPNVVKRAIEDLVEFREDVFYIRDIGNETEDGVRTPCKSITELTNADLFNSKSRYIATYSPWYDIKDPYTKKQITVTIGYSLARIATKHFINGRNRPMCGIKFEVTIPEAIEGTVSFIPKITPAGNQKTEMEDLRINYASYLDGTFTVETCYTSQEKYTQLSFSNNVQAIQEIIHVIRKKVPKSRYTFMDSDDFDSYQSEVNSILSKYSGNFMSLTMEYIGDSIYESNKIYYAVIKVQFRNFVQTEMFKIIALQS